MLLIALFGNYKTFIAINMWLLFGVDINSFVKMRMSRHSPRQNEKINKK
jgi:hypothetical protein